MNGLDIVLGALILGVALAETVRGFGRALWDAMTLYGALWLAHTLSPMPGGGPVAYGLLFVGFASLALWFSRWMYSVTLVHTGMFESLLGLATGLAAGAMLAHGVVCTVVRTPVGQQVVSSSVLGGRDAVVYHLPHDHGCFSRRDDGTEPLAGLGKLKKIRQTSRNFDAKV